MIYSICDSNNCKLVINDLMSNLNILDLSIRQDVVIKASILVEKYTTDSFFYVDVMFKLSCDFSTDEVWHRIIQVISYDIDLQMYSCRILMNLLNEPCHENLVKLCGYVFGEYGHLIVDQAGFEPIHQLSVLEKRLKDCTSSTRSLLLTTFLKFANVYPEIKSNVLEIFDRYRHVLDVELQQRACEYHAIVSLESNLILEAVCLEIPPFPARESALLKRLQKQIYETQDKRIWIIGGCFC